MISDSSIQYILDPKDVIVDINGKWDQFAVENDCQNLSVQTVIGTSIWDYVTGMEVTHLYQLIFEEVRKSNKTMGFQFRCDSPKEKRYMEMNVRHESGDVYLVSSLLNTQDHESTLPILDSTIPTSEEFIYMCSWCRAIQLEEHEWVSLEDGVVKLDLFSKDMMPKISHGICSSCHKTISNELSD